MLIYLTILYVRNTDSWVIHLFHTVPTEVISGGARLGDGCSNGSLIHLAPWQGQLEGWAQLILSPGGLTWGLSSTAA